MLRDLFSLFPAYAGVIPTTPGSSSLPTTFPRIREGDPSWDKRVRAAATFPRIRGVDPMHMADCKRQVALSPYTRGLPKDPSQGFA